MICETDSQYNALTAAKIVDIYCKAYYVLDYSP
jgi:hypothetical protein